MPTLTYSMLNKHSWVSHKGPNDSFILISDVNFISYNIFLLRSHNDEHWIKICKKKVRFDCCQWTKCFLKRWAWFAYRKQLHDYPTVFQPFSISLWCTVNSNKVHVKAYYKGKHTVTNSCLFNVLLHKSSSDTPFNLASILVSAVQGPVCKIL